MRHDLPRFRTRAALDWWNSAMERLEGGWINARDHRRMIADLQRELGDALKPKTCRQIRREKLTGCETTTDRVIENPGLTTRRTR